MKRVYIASLTLFWGLVSYGMESFPPIQTHATMTDQTLYSLRNTVLALKNSYCDACQREA